MKRFFQLLVLAVAALGLSNCTTYVDDGRYASGRSLGYGYRSSSIHTHPVAYRSSSRYYSGRSSYSNRHSRYDRHDHHRRDDDRHNVRYRRDDDRRNYHRTRAGVNTRVNTNLGLFR